MSNFCNGELNGVCVVALALRGRVTSMDAYLFGQMDPEKAVCCIYHNYAHHDTIITEQMENLRRIVEVRVQQCNHSDDSRAISMEVLRMLTEVINDATARERLIQSSLNWH